MMHRMMNYGVAMTTPQLLENIQNITLEVTPSNMGLLQMDVGAGIDLRNANAVTSITNDGSQATLGVYNIGSTIETLHVHNTNFNTYFNLAANADVADIALHLSNVTGGAVVDVDGVETINVASHEMANDVQLDFDAATTINIAGDADLAAVLGWETNSVTSINAALLTGDLDLVVSEQIDVLSTTDITVVSGQGNDTIDVSAVQQDYVVTLGAGNDTLVDENITVNDSVIGGEGTDTLSTVYNSAVGLTAKANNVDGIDVLELTDDLRGGLDLTKVDSTITTLDLDGSESLVSAASTVTGPAGTLTVELGGKNSGVLDNALTVVDTGTAVTDTVNFVNYATDHGYNQDVFHGQNITSSGYENVTINTGAASNDPGQSINTLTITADAAIAPVSLAISGTNSIDINQVSTNSNALTTINASGLNIRGTDVGLVLGSEDAAGLQLGVLGTASVVGSVGEDFVRTGNYAATVDGAAGDDMLIGGTAADVLLGGTGNDSLVGVSGNDVLRGGEGNDVIVATSLQNFGAPGAVTADGGAGNDIVAMLGSLTSTDVVDGGEGIDNLALTTTATADVAIGVKNFEILSTTTDQTASNFINNGGWTTVIAAGEDVAIDNASSTLNTFQVIDLAEGGNMSFDRLADTGTDSLTFATFGTEFDGVDYSFDGTIASLTVNDEETLTIDVSNGASSVGGALEIQTLNASDLTTLKLVGDHSVVIDGPIVGATKLATVDASGITAGSSPYTGNVVDVDASNSTVAVTMIGAGSVANFFVGGVNADSITGGAKADVLIGNSGADQIVAGGGNDFVDGGQGADSISAGGGNDTIVGGTEADVITLSADSARDTVVQGANDSVIISSTSITAGGNFTAGSTLTFGNGVDIVRDFSAGTGGDVLNLAVAPVSAVSQSLLNQSSTVATYGYLSGNFNAATGVFTVTANGIGADTLVLQSNGGATLANNQSAVVLAGVKSSSLVDGNFSGTQATSVTATYAAPTWTIAGNAITALNIDATTGSIDPESGVTYVGTYNPATETTVNLSGLTGGNGANVNFNGATVNALLSSVVGSTGNDVYTFTNADLGAPGGTTFAASTGNDTLVLTNVETDVTIGGGGQASTLTAIDTISLTNGTRNLADTATATLTIGNDTIAQAVTNASATDAATVILSNVVGSSYSSQSSGVDTVTLGAAAQSVTLGGGGADNVNTTIANSLGSTYIGSAAATEILTFTGTAGTINLGATANGTQMGISGVDTIVTQAGINTINVTPGQNITINAAAAGGALTTIAGTGNTIAVTQGTNASDAITLSGTSAFSVTSGFTGGAAITSTSTGALNVLLGQAGQSVTSASTTTVNAIALADNALLTIAGAANFTVSGLQGDITSSASGFTDVTLVDVATLTATNNGSGVMTIDAGAMTDNDVLTLAGNFSSGGRFVVNNVSDSDVGTSSPSSYAGGATITGTATSTGAAVTQNIFGTAGNDSVSIVAGTAPTPAYYSTINATTGGGIDTINLSGVAYSFTADAGTDNDTINLSGTALSGFNITGGTGADTVTVGTGVATVNLATPDTGANSSSGVNVTTTGFDVYQGLNVGDKLVITTANYTGAWTPVSSTTSVGGVANNIVFTQGTYNAAANLFTASATGADSLVTWDVDGGSAPDTFDAVVLVGFVGTGTDSFASNVHTFTL